LRKANFFQFLIFQNRKKIVSGGLFNQAENGRN